MKLLRNFLTTTAVAAAVVSTSLNAQAKIEPSYTQVEQNVMLQAWQYSENLNRFAHKDLSLGDFFTILSRVPYLNQITVQDNGDGNISTHIDVKEISGYLKQYCPVEDKSKFNAVYHGCYNVIYLVLTRNAMAANNLTQYYDVGLLTQRAKAARDTKTTNLLARYKLNSFYDIKVTQTDLDRLEISKFLKQNYDIRLVPNPEQKPAPTKTKAKDKKRR